mgnify:CR=1 FL=1
MAPSDSNPSDLNQGAPSQADLEALVTESLNPNEYALLIAPVLEIVTEVAAKRGDPTCYNDMSAMLALFTVVTGLCRCYEEEWGQLGNASSSEVLNSAPLGACIMVFTQAELPAEAIQDMLRGLSGAWRHLVKEGVIGGEFPIIQQAWRKLVEQDSTTAKIHLRDAVMAVVASVDEWESQQNYKEITLN